MAYHANDPDVGMSLVMNLRYYINLLHYNNRLLLSLHFPDDSNILPITKLYKLKIAAGNQFKIVQFKIAGVAETNSKFKTQNSKFDIAKYRTGSKKVLQIKN